MILMLSGHAGCGKDTAYKLIGKNFAWTRRFSFADRLKKIARALTWDGNKDTKGRKFLQDLGQVARAYNKNVWADIVANDIDACGHSIVVITDFRFPNEAEVIKKHSSDVYTIRITGRNKDLGENENDISEHALDDYKFDYYIDNSGTMVEFENKLVNLIEGLF